MMMRAVFFATTTLPLKSLDKKQLSNVQDCKATDQLV